MNKSLFLTVDPKFQGEVLSGLVGELRFYIFGNAKENGNCIARFGANFLDR